MRTATAPFTLRRARTLEGALKILREEPGTVPIAGCTDVYVALEFGGTPGTRYLDLTPPTSRAASTSMGSRARTKRDFWSSVYVASAPITSRSPLVVMRRRLASGVRSR